MSIWRWDFLKLGLTGDGDGNSSKATYQWFRKKWHLSDRVHETGYDNDNILVISTYTAKWQRSDNNMTQEWHQSGNKTTTTWQGNGCNMTIKWQHKSKMRTVCQNYDFIFSRNCRPKIFPKHNICIILVSLSIYLYVHIICIHLQYQ